MRDAEFYKLLQGTDHRETDWARSAEQFLKLKIASGGLTQQQVDDLHRKVKVAHRFRETVKTAGLGAQSYQEEPSVVPPMKRVSSCSFMKARSSPGVPNCLERTGFRSASKVWMKMSPVRPVGSAFVPPE